MNNNEKQYKLAICEKIDLIFTSLVKKYNMIVF